MRARGPLERVRARGPPPHVSSLLVGSGRVTTDDVMWRWRVNVHAGGNKRLYRAVDFKRKVLDTVGTVVRLEYDPNRCGCHVLSCCRVLTVVCCHVRWNSPHVLNYLVPCCCAYVCISGMYVRCLCVCMCVHVCMDRCTHACLYVNVCTNLCMCVE